MIRSINISKQIKRIKPYSKNFLRFLFNLKVCDCILIYDTNILKEDVLSLNNENTKYY